MEELRNGTKIRKVKFANNGFDRADKLRDKVNTAKEVLNEKEISL